MPAGDYTPLRRLGEGSYGQVFLVQHRSTGRQFVLKEVELTRDNKQAALREAKIVQALRHPNIIEQFEFYESTTSVARSQLAGGAALRGGAVGAAGRRRSSGSGSSWLHLILALAEGGDLARRIEGRRGGGGGGSGCVPFDEAEVLDYFIQICLALKHAHDRRILHRDIKPQNIFLTMTNSVKLGDFGVARELAWTAEQARTQIGTPFYLAPELCRGRPYGAAADMWSTGVILFQLMTLQLPFQATSLPQLLEVITKRPHALPAAASRRFSADLCGLLDALLHKDPAQRPSSNAVLRLPFVRQHVHRFLERHVLEEEFSHTVLHRHAVGHHAPPPPAAPELRPAAAPPRPPQRPAEGAGAGERPTARDTAAEVATAARVQAARCELEALRARRRDDQAQHERARFAAAQRPPEPWHRPQPATRAAAELPAQGRIREVQPAPPPGAAQARRGAAARATGAAVAALPPPQRVQNQAAAPRDWRHNVDEQRRALAAARAAAAAGAAAARRLSGERGGDGSSNHAPDALEVLLYVPAGGPPAQQPSDQPPQPPAQYSPPSLAHCAPRRAVQPSSPPSPPPLQAPPPEPQRGSPHLVRAVSGCGQASPPAPPPVARSNGAYAANAGASPAVARRGGAGGGVAAADERAGVERQAGARERSETDMREDARRQYLDNRLAAERNRRRAVAAEWGDPVPDAPPTVVAPLPRAAPSDDALEGAAGAAHGRRNAADVQPAAAAAPAAAAVAMDELARIRSEYFEERRRLALKIKAQLYEERWGRPMDAAPAPPPATPPAPPPPSAPSSAAPVHADVDQDEALRRARDEYRRDKAAVLERVRRRVAADRGDTPAIAPSAPPPVSVGVDAVCTSVPTAVHDVAPTAVAAPPAAAAAAAAATAAAGPLSELEAAEVRAAGDFLALLRSLRAELGQADRAAPDGGGGGGSGEGVVDDGEVFEVHFVREGESPFVR